MQAERAQRSRQDAEARADALQSSFDKLDKARERTRGAISATRGGAPFEAASQRTPSLRDLDPVSRAGSIRGDLVGRSRSNVTGLDRIMTGEGYRLKTGVTIREAQAVRNSRDGDER